MNDVLNGGRHFEFYYVHIIYTVAGYQTQSPPGGNISMSAM